MQEANASRKAVNDVFRLVSDGQLDLAEQKCKLMLIDHPQDVNILGLHGAILLKLGHTDAAQAALVKAITLEPGFAKPHEDLGRLFLVRKEPEKAAHHFTQAVGLSGSQPSAFSGLASALAQLGKIDEANAAHQQFLERSPVASTLLEAEKLLSGGDGARAQQLCHELLKREPENTQLMRMLARIASEDQKFAAAEELLRRIIELSPYEYLPHNELGRFLVEQSRIPEAIEMFEQAALLDKSKVDNFRLMGDAQAMIGKLVDALASYQHALQLQPRDPHALAGHGHMLRISGGKEGAIASYEKCTAERPEFGDAWWSLASMKGYRLSEKQADTIHSQITAGDLDPESEVGMRFALARAAESRGDFEGAWQEYCLGNSLKRQLIQYDPVQTETMHDAIIEQFSREFLDRATTDDAVKHTPIFILGMPRSGSTLIEQILASHSLVEGAGELPYVIMLSSTLGGQRADGMRYPEVLSELTEAQLLSLGRAYLYHSNEHRGKGLPFFTDKMPANFSHVGLINLMLPKAKIIDARRHPMATSLANFRQLYAQGKNQTYDLVELAEYFVEYCRIMEHWQKVLPDRVLRVQYEDVVTDLEGQVRRVLEFCDLPWESTCLEFHRNARPVNTASADQVREPIYSDAVEFWKHYESNLETIREILAPVMPRCPTKRPTLPPCPPEHNRK